MAAQVILEFVPDFTKVESGLDTLEKSGGDAAAFKKGNEELEKRKALFTQNVQAQRSVVEEGRKEAASMGQVTKAINDVTNAVVKVVGQNLEKHLRDTSNAANVARTSLTGMAGAVGDLDSEAKSVDQTLNDLEDQMRALALAGQQNSTEFRALAAQAGNAQRAINVTSAAIDQAASRTKAFDKLAIAAQGITAAFGVTQGIMALFGLTSESTEKSIQKMVAVMTILESIGALAQVVQTAQTFTLGRLTLATAARTAAEAASAAAIRATTTATAAATAASLAQTLAQQEANGVSIRNMVNGTFMTAGQIALADATAAATVATAAQTEATVAQTEAQVAQNAAMAANPVLLIVTAIALLIPLVIWLTSSTEEATEAQEGFNDAIGKTNLDKYLEDLDLAVEKQIALAKAGGASELEITDMLIRANEERKIARQMQIQLNETLMRHATTQALVNEIATNTRNQTNELKKLEIERINLGKQRADQLKEEERLLEDGRQEQLKFIEEYNKKRDELIQEGLQKQKDANTLQKKEDVAFTELQLLNKQNALKKEDGLSEESLAKQAKLNEEILQLQRELVFRKQQLNSASNEMTFSEDQLAVLQSTNAQLKITEDASEKKIAVHRKTLLRIAELTAQNEIEDQEARIEAAKKVEDKALQDARIRGSKLRMLRVRVMKEEWDLLDIQLEHENEEFDEQTEENVRRKKLGLETIEQDQEGHNNRVMRLQKKMNEKQIEMDKAVIDAKKFHWGDFSKWLESVHGAEVVQVLQDTADAVFELEKAHREARLAEEVAALEAQKEEASKTANLTAAQKLAIEKAYDRQISKLKNENAKKERKAQIIQAIVNGLLAVTMALATNAGPLAFIAAAFAAASSAVAVAKIAASPLPKYAKGTKNAKKGYAWVGEEGPELVKMRGGETVYTAKQSKELSKSFAMVDHTGTITYSRENSGMDYDALGRAVAKHMPVHTPSTVNMTADENGLTIFIDKAHSRQTIRNKRHSTRG